MRNTTGENDMRIATYNIWNSQDGMPYRTKHLVEEINKIYADIICLQEVSNNTLAKEISQLAGYKFLYFENYSDEDEGLAILSKMPFLKSVSLFGRANALIVLLEVYEKRLCVANIHLPWNSTINREKQIIEVTSYLEAEQLDYAILAGDFNCTESSDVNRFLLGECSLYGMESTYNWYDLAYSYAERMMTKPDCTLNFTKNPRFTNNTIENNSRVDRIMLRNTYPMEFPKLMNCHIWGQKIYDDTRLAASDHYGVLAEIIF